MDCELRKLKQDIYKAKVLAEKFVNENKKQHSVGEIYFACKMISIGIEGEYPDIKETTEELLDKGISYNISISKIRRGDEKNG